jgi:hypothetical protein
VLCDEARLTTTKRRSERHDQNIDETLDSVRAKRALGNRRHVIGHAGRATAVTRQS